VVRSLLGSFGGMKLYILGVAGYNKPIWDVLALQGEQEEAGEHLQGAKFVELFPIRQMVSGGSLWTLGLGLAVGYIVLVLSTYKHT